MLDIYSGCCFIVVSCFFVLTHVAVICDVITTADTWYFQMTITRFGRVLPCREWCDMFIVLVIVWCQKYFVWCRQTLQKSARWRIKSLPFPSMFRTHKSQRYQPRMLAKQTTTSRAGDQQKGNFSWIYGFKAWPSYELSYLHI